MPNGAALPRGTVAVAPMPDLDRLLSLVPENEEITAITVVQNWQAGLGK